MCLDGKRPVGGEDLEQERQTPTEGVERPYAEVAFVVSGDVFVETAEVPVAEVDTGRAGFVGADPELSLGRGTRLFAPGKLRQGDVRAPGVVLDHGLDAVQRSSSTFFPATRSGNSEPSLVLMVVRKECADDLAHATAVAPQQPVLVEHLEPGVRQILHEALRRRDGMHGVALLREHEYGEREIAQALDIGYRHGVGQVAQRLSHPGAEEDLGLLLDPCPRRVVAAHGLG